MLLPRQYISQSEVQVHVCPVSYMQYKTLWRLLREMRRVSREMRNVTREMRLASREMRREVVAYF